MKHIIILSLVMTFISCRTKSDDRILMDNSIEFIQNATILNENFPNVPKEYFQNIGIYNKQYGPSLIGYENKILKCSDCMAILRKNKLIGLEHNSTDDLEMEFDKYQVEYYKRFGNYDIPIDVIDSTKNILVSFRRPMYGVLPGIIFLKSEFQNEDKPYVDFLLFYDEKLDIIELLY